MKRLIASLCLIVLMAFSAPAWSTSYYVNGRSTVTGVVTSGTFQDAEVIQQAVTLATALIVNTNANVADSVPAAGPMAITNIVPIGGSAPDSSHTWIGLTSGAVFAPTAAPVALGNDGNDGLSPSTPWATIAYALATLTGDQSDNSLLLNRGDAWTGAVANLPHGTSGHPFTFSSYGNGNNPRIYSAVCIPSGSLWTKTAGKTNVYEAAITGYNLINTWSSEYGYVWYGEQGDYLWEGESGVKWATPSIALVDSIQQSAWWNSNKIYIHWDESSIYGGEYDPTVVGHENYWIGCEIVTIMLNDANWTNITGIDAYYTGIGGVGIMDLGVSLTSNIILDNVNINFAAADGFNFCGTNHRIKNCKVIRGAEFGFVVSSHSSLTTDNIKYENCEFVSGIVGTNPEWNYPGILKTSAFVVDNSDPSGSGVTNSHFINNKVSGECKNAFSDSGSAATTLDGLIVTGNATDYLVNSADSSNLVVKNVSNTIPVSAGRAINVQGVTNLELCWNTIRCATEYAISVSFTQPGIFKYHHNILIGSGTVAPAYGMGLSINNNAVLSYSFIYNNVFDGYFYAVVYNYDYPIEVYDNIAINSTVLLSCPTTIANLISDYNCAPCQRSIGYPGAHWGTINGVGTDFPTAWQALGQDLHSTDEYPLFVSATDYHLQAGSPCLQTGTPIPGDIYYGPAPNMGVFQEATGAGFFGLN